MTIISDIHSRQVKSCVTDKHNTKYNTLISEQPYIDARWSIFTFPEQNEPRRGHGTPWVNSGTIPAIPGCLASLPTRSVFIMRNIMECIISKYPLTHFCMYSMLTWLKHPHTPALSRAS